ncbi:hypothetical protein BGZ70_007980 [Mortierella alpina]|uniref:F-box domain-containing protein n=1 Tax=Mortierella alpina TaxID=64518 RepID=A0A9P6JFX0_MORAP|nr:hypothetical protein BGZ70_007980 [Mortierella alpina]
MHRGHIFCHDCSSRSIALPQLGYTKAVRVCNGCFEVAYLVAYCLSDDLGPSTQIHGARGLYELIETNDEKVLENVIEHGGLDAIVYLCSVVHGFELHALATKSLAALSDHQVIQGMIVAKRAMPKLFHLVAAYAYHVASPLRPPSPPMPLTRMASTASLHTTGVRRIETIAAVLIHITHIVYQMVPDKLLARQMAKEGAVDGLMCLCVYFPAGVRTRAMEHAIQSVSRARDEAIRAGANTPLSDSQRGDDDTQSQRSTPLQASHGEDEEDEAGVVSMDDLFHVQLENMQGQAARCLSVLAGDVSNQAFIVDDPERIDRLVQLLYSNNPDVVKYASKTMAYLSLRNDRYKPDIVKGAGAAALLTVIRTGSESHSSSNGNALSEAVSHACCALANLATNTESQEILMSHLDLLNATCSVVGLFPHQREIERHVARLIANLALYDQNKLSLLTAYSTPSDRASLDSSQGARDPHPVAVPHRYSSPPPPARRAKGNVIPTLLYIGAQTLERTGVVENSQDEAVYLQQGQDAVDFMNDDHAHAEAGYLTPNDSASENDVGYGEHERSIHDEVIAEWATVPGMEDVQRHIIRAIDNLITSVMDDPASHQSFKVFSRIWPTIGLIKTIQMTNQDEDTQRRATHVLSTLVHQQQIHAETSAALKERSPSPEPEADADGQLNGLGEEEQLEQQRLAEEQQRLAKEAAAAARKAAELEQARLDKEKHVSEQVVKKQKERNERKAAKEKLEQEKAEREAREAEEERDRLQKKAEEERLEAEREEQERVAVERVKKEKIEWERLEKDRLEKERLEQEQLEKDRLKQERSEKKRLENERLEKERLENERLEKERLEKERLEKERVEKERLEKERVEKERLEKERVEKERLEKERVEKERLEKERLDEERLEEEHSENERLEKERLEEERLEMERLEEERLEQARFEEERLEEVRLEMERLEKERDDHLAPEQIQAQEEQAAGSDSTKTGPKGGRTAPLLLHPPCESHAPKKRTGPLPPLSLVNKTPAAKGRPHHLHTLHHLSLQPAIEAPPMLPLPNPPTCGARTQARASPSRPSRPRSCKRGRTGDRDISSVRTVSQDTVFAIPELLSLVTAYFDKSDLRALMRVCRAWNAFWVPHLYSKLFFCKYKRCRVYPRLATYGVHVKALELHTTKWNNVLHLVDYTPNLTSLAMYRVTLSLVQFKEMVTSVPHLRSLSLTVYETSSESHDWPLVLTSALPGLEEFSWIGDVSVIGDNHTKMRIDDILHILKSCTKLRSLRLAHVAFVEPTEPQEDLTQQEPMALIKVEDEGWQSNSLQLLDCNYVDFGPRQRDEGAVEQVQPCVRRLFQHTPNLKTLKVRGVSDLRPADWVAVFKSGTSLEYVALEQFGGAFFDSRPTFINVKDALVMISTVCTNLKVLSTRFAQGATDQHFASILRANRQLQRLCVKRTGFGDTSLGELGRIPLGLSTAGALTDHSIVELDIQGCHQVTAAGVLLVLENCRFLQSLNLTETSAGTLELFNGNRPWACAKSLEALHIDIQPMGFQQLSHSAWPNMNVTPPRAAYSLAEQQTINERLCALTGLTHLELRGENMDQEIFNDASFAPRLSKAVISLPTLAGEGLSRDQQMRHLVKIGRNMFPGWRLSTMDGFYSRKRYWIISALRMDM